MEFTPAEIKETPFVNEKLAVRREIESQIIQIDIKLKAEVLVSKYVALLSEKLQLQQLLKNYQDEN